MNDAYIADWNSEEENYILWCIKMKNQVLNNA